MSDMSGFLFWGWISLPFPTSKSASISSTYLQTGFDRHWGFLHVGRALTTKDFRVTWEFLGIPGEFLAIPSNSWDHLGSLSVWNIVRDISWRFVTFRVSKSEELLAAQHPKAQQIGSQALGCRVATKLMNQTPRCQENEHNKNIQEWTICENISFYTFLFSENSVRSLAELSKLSWLGYRLSYHVLMCYVFVVALWLFMVDFVS